MNQNSHARFDFGRALVVGYVRHVIYSTLPENRGRDLKCWAEQFRARFSGVCRRAEIDKFCQSGYHRNPGMVMVGIQLLKEYIDAADYYSERRAMAMYFRCVGFREALEDPEGYAEALSEIHRAVSKSSDRLSKAVYGVRLELELAERARRAKLHSRDLNEARMHTLRALKFARYLNKVQTREGIQTSCWRDHNLKVPGIERVLRLNRWMIAVDRHDWTRAKLVWQKIVDRIALVLGDSWLGILEKDEILDHVDLWVRSDFDIPSLYLEQLLRWTHQLRNRDRYRDRCCIEWKTQVDFTVEALEGRAVTT